MINRVFNENCLDTMGRMPDNYIDMVLTSPPYDSLRDYHDEASVMFVEQFPNIIKELFRVIKEGGVMVWVVNDGTVDGGETGTSFRQALSIMDVGFRLHDTMIYQKIGVGNPGSAYQYYPMFEYMFVFSIGRPKTFNPIYDVPNKNNEGSKKLTTKRDKDGTTRPVVFEVKGNMSKRGNVWKIDSGFRKSAVEEFVFKHPAIFPEKLAEDHIVSWSDEGDIVYDPMAGSGTTLVMASKHGRSWIGSEMSEQYYTDVIIPRLNNMTMPLL